MNGAELIAQIDRMTMGWWRPSPGSIYPLLEEFEKEKLVRKNPDGRYELTEAARGGPDWMRGGFAGGSGPRNPEDAVRELEAYATYLEDIARSERDRVHAISDRLLDVVRRLDALAKGAASAAR
jgi:DNA-binding PadR family transcriptional regulator